MQAQIEWEFSSEVQHVRLGLTGNVIGVCRYKFNPVTVCVEYQKADGAVVEDWFPASDLKLIASGS